MGLQLLGLAAGAQPDPADVGDDVWAQALQSNAAGAGGGIDIKLDRTDPRIWQFAGSGAYKDQRVEASEGLYGPLGQSGSVSMALPFARELVKALPSNRNVLIVPAAQGGTGFTTTDAAGPPPGYTAAAGTWDLNGPGTNLAAMLIAQLTKAVNLSPKNRFAGLLICGGEADSGFLTWPQYAAQLDALWAAVLAQVPRSDGAVLVIGSMVPEWVGANAARLAIQAAHIDTLSRQQRAGFALGPAGYLYTGDGLGIHYSAAGRRARGPLLLDAYRRAKANISGSGPVAPTAITFSQSGTAVTIGWTPPYGRVTDYTVQTRVNGGAWADLSRPATVAGPDIARTITGLTLGDVLEARVATVNEVGPSSYATSSPFTLATIPGQVTGLAHGTVGSSSVPCTWTATPGATSYLIESSPSGAGTWTTAATSATNSVTVGGLTPSTAYDFRVSAVNAAGTGTPSATVSATTNAPTALLSDVPVSAYFAYSVTRKLRTAYAGSAFKVRRDSDNTTQNIGFTGTGDVDTAALLTFCGAANGFIDTLYDQSGNTRDLAQATAANQPQIVAAGNLIVQNGHLAMLFSATGSTASEKYLTRAGGGLAPTTSAGAATIMELCQLSKNGAPGGSGQVRFNESNGTAAATNARYSPSWSNQSGSVTSLVTNDAGTQEAAGSATLAAVDEAAHVVTSKDTGTQVLTYVDGTLSVTATVTRTSTHTYSRQTLGTQYIGTTGVSSSIAYDGKHQELVGWASALSDVDRGAGRANMQNYYGTP